MAYRSHITQELLNYFPHQEVRTRRTPWTLEAQLLNVASCQVEESNLRLGREIDARKLGHTPLNLDNGGVWYRLQVPPSIDTPASITGVRNGQTVALREYDDTLPVPSAVEYDSSRKPALCPSLTLASLAGNGFVVHSGALSLPIPSRVFFWLSGLGDFSGQVEIEIAGDPHPRTYWAAMASPDSEVLLASDEGSFRSERIWESISDITVRRLPEGASLAVCLFDFALPQQTDEMRPYTDPAARQALYGLGWSASGSLLVESYFPNRWQGWQPVRSRRLPAEAASIALEPNTYGLVAAAGEYLLYLDRREPVPDHLYRSTINAEPLYGLEVQANWTQPGPGRHVTLAPVAYTRAAQLTQFRYRVQKPDGSWWNLSPKGDLVAADALGWFHGVPPAITLGLPETQAGTWWFSLEQTDRNGTKTEDHQPWICSVEAPLASLPTTTIVPSLVGAGFDSYQQLWLWSGDFLVPARLRHDAYLYDPATRSVYMTDTYDEVRLA